MNCCNNNRSRMPVNANRPTLKRKFENGKLQCIKCGATQELPTHCGKPMQKVGDKLICWRGSQYGSQPIPNHCGVPMNVKI